MLLCDESVRLGTWREALRLSALASRMPPWTTLDGPEVVWRQQWTCPQDSAVVGGPPPPAPGLHGVVEKLSCSRAGLAGQGVLPSWVSKVGPCQQGTPANSFFFLNAKICSSARERVPVLPPCIHLTVGWPQPMVAFLWELSLQLL